MLLMLFILILLLKTHFLVPNLWLYDLAFKNFGQKRLKFFEFLSENETRKAFKGYSYP